jgi:hypothetical protein
MATSWAAFSGIAVLRKWAKMVVEAYAVMDSVSVQAEDSHMAPTAAFRFGR